MSDALTPELAVAYLAELQPGATGVAIRRVEAGEGPQRGGEDVVRARSGNLEIAAIPAGDGLPGLLAHDCERVLEVIHP